MIDKATTDRIYAAANIVDVINDFVTLKKKGVNYQACCPFHNEKTPSFVVSPAKGLYKCFGCGKGGNAVTFVMEHENMTYPEALKYVAKKYGIDVQERELTPQEQQKNDDRESMMIVSSYAEEYFRDQLKKTDEGRSGGLSYFRHRGFTDATIEKFRLGYCPSKGDSFTTAALAAGYKEEFLTASGLTIKRESGGYHDRFAGRVMFPIHSISGRVTAFGGRTLRTDKNIAKYLNSPESEIYHKSNILYGLFFAKRAITQEDFCILVEGYTDVISMHQAGVENVVASSGTSLTQEQIRLIARFTKNVTVIYDGDSAGIKASLRGIDMILREGLNVRVVLLPDQDDPDSFARKHNASELKAWLRANEQDFLTFKAKLLSAEAGNDPIKRASLITDMIESISMIPEPVTRSVYIKECARTMDVEEQLLITEVARKRISHTGDAQAEEFVRREQTRMRNTIQQPSSTSLASTPSINVGSSIEGLEKELIKYLLKYGNANFDYREGRNTVSLNVAATIITELRNNDLSFTNPCYQNIYKTYLDLYDHKAHPSEQIPIHHFINHPDPDVCNTTVDILTSDDIYVASQIWKKHEISISTEQDRLYNAVPRTIILYKSKAIDNIIDVLKKQLDDPSLEDDRLGDILKRIAALNKERINISKKLSRLII